MKKVKLETISTDDYLHYCNKLHATWINNYRFDNIRSNEKAIKKILKALIHFAWENNKGTISDTYLKMLFDKFLDMSKRYNEVIYTDPSFYQLASDHNIDVAITYLQMLENDGQLHYDINY